MGLFLTLRYYGKREGNKYLHFKGHRSSFCIKVPFGIGHPILCIKYSLYVCGRAQGSQICKQNSIISIRSKVIAFLGGLSLHLNHLIASRTVNYDWPFGTLPFGLFGSNLDTRDLETYPRTYSGHF